MTVERVLPVLLLAAIAYLLLGRWSRGRRVELGIEAGAVVSADDSLARAPTLRSARLGLVGRCDLMLRVGGAYVPVEHKPSARRLQPSHILQVAALCLLVGEAYGVRPPYAVVVLAGGVRERVEFTDELERKVLQTMSEMRAVLATGESPGPRWVAQKCRPCGYAPACWGSKASQAATALGARDPSDR